jgi:hypothetical protein
MWTFNAVEKERTANKVLPKAGQNGFDWAFVQGSTFVLRLNFVLKIPAFGNTQTVSGNSLATVQLSTDRHKTKGQCLKQ